MHNGRNAHPAQNHGVQPFLWPPDDQKRRHRPSLDYALQYRRGTVAAGGPGSQVVTGLGDDLQAYMAEPYRCLSAHVNLHLPTDITSELIEGATAALDQFYESGHGFLKGDIMLYELSEADRRQMTLMEAAVNPAQEKKRALMTALDKVHDKYGRDTIRLAAQGPTAAFWQMRREK